MAASKKAAKKKVTKRKVVRKKKVSAAASDDIAARVRVTAVRIEEAVGRKAKEMKPKIKAAGKRAKAEAKKARAAATKAAAKAGKQARTQAKKLAKRAEAELVKIRASASIKKVEPFDFDLALVKTLGRLGGSATPLAASRMLFKRYEKRLRKSGDVFYTWQGDLKAVATRLRKMEVLKPAKAAPGKWELA